MRYGDFFYIDDIINNEIKKIKVFTIEDALNYMSNFNKKLFSKRKKEEYYDEFFSTIVEKYSLSNNTIVEYSYNNFFQRFKLLKNSDLYFEYEKNDSFPSIITQAKIKNKDIIINEYIDNYRYSKENNPSFIKITNFEEFKKTGKFNGKIEYYFNGEFHNENGPAIIITDEYYKNIEYLINGKFHNINNPACIEYILKKDKSIRLYSEYWYTNDELSRYDKPAISEIKFENNKTIETYKFKINDLYERKNAPAYEYYENNKLKAYTFYENNIIHRLDKPAIVDFNYSAYSLFGKTMSKNQYNSFIKNLKNINNYKFKNLKYNLTCKQLLEIAYYYNFKKAIDFLEPIVVINSLENS